MINRVFKDIITGKRITTLDLGVTWISDDRLLELGYVEVDKDYVEPIQIESLKSAKLQQISRCTEEAIVGGFVSAASGVQCKYDSTRDDQDNIRTMYSASLSPSFDTDIVYHGLIPIRGIPDGSDSKVVNYLNKMQMQTLIDDLARHIGACKLRGWQLQQAVNNATTEEELNNVVW